MDTSIILIGVWLFALYASITVHEFMHAWTANYLGDPTAKALGRVSLNPLAHIDMFGTVLLPLLLLFSTGGKFVFGYAKPVPINPNNFKNRSLGEALTSIAGPAGNLLLLLVFTAIYKFIPGQNEIFQAMTLIFIELNVVLMVFNLIPVPPLDGSKLIYSLFPNAKWVDTYETYGPFILIPVVILFGPYIIEPIITAILAFLGIH
jgi:Zn-dependent protease